MLASCHFVSTSKDILQWTSRKYQADNMSALEDDSYQQMVMYLQYQLSNNQPWWKENITEALTELNKNTYKLLQWNVQ